MMWYTFDEGVVYVSTGSRIKDLRIKKGLTQRQLGELIGMADSAIRRYESDRGNPTAKTLRRIADALEVPVDSLLYDGNINITIYKPKYALHLPSQEKMDLMTPAEQEYYYLRLLADTAPDVLREKLTDSYDALNKLGQVEAVRRMQELSRLSEYTEPDPNHKPIGD